ncbi:MAG TPA: hypothetical protein VL563_02635 [Gemmatimonadales bacterium]|jgi:hypothetical protein|nr:hypothetical protein [Gemmatimonadales bacterium]
MRVPSFGLLSPAVVAGMLAAPPLAMSQAVALPLRGEGEFALADKQYDVRAGSVLLKADSTVKIFFIDGTSLRTAVVGAWRSRNASTIEFAVLDVPGERNAQGSGRIRFRPDGSIDALDVRGQADGRDFSARFENGMSTAALTASEQPKPRATPPSRQGDDEWPWGGSSFVVNVSQRGEGALQEKDGSGLRFDRARLWLGQNDEFQLLLVGDSRYEVAGRWSGDLRFGPVPLEVREADGHRVQGQGRAWIRDRSWDRDFSLERVEIDVSDGEHEFSLYFDTEVQSTDPAAQ